MKSYLIILIGLGLLAFILTACGGAEPETVAPQPEPVTIQIDMSEYQFSPDHLELMVGQKVTLNLVNHGALEHELMIGRQIQMMDSKPAGYHMDMFAEAGVEPVVMQTEMHMDKEEAHQDDEHAEHSGFMVTVPTGDAEASMTFTVTKAMVGEWEMGCFLLDGVHYQAGMKGTVVVKEG